EAYGQSTKNINPNNNKNLHGNMEWVVIEYDSNKNEIMAYNSSKSYRVGFDKPASFIMPAEFSSLDRLMIGAPNFTVAFDEFILYERLLDPHEVSAIT